MASKLFEKNVLYNLFPILENIKVRFYEEDMNGEVVWEDWGRFTEADVHHQYAIALRTPPYSNLDIEQSVSADRWINIVSDTPKGVVGNMLLYGGAQIKKKKFPYKKNETIKPRPISLH